MDLPLRKWVGGVNSFKLYDVATHFHKPSPVVATVCGKFLVLYSKRYSGKVCQTPLIISDAFPILLHHTS